jgi:Catalytic LigB subunit of aromatic ring-opening dioxygenase
MAQLVGVLNMSHGPFTDMAPEKWTSVRQSRPPYRADVPIDSEEEQVAKAERIRAGLDVMRAKLEEMRPDVLVIFGDDQLENFDFNNYPSLSVFVGDEFKGADHNGRGRPETYHTVKNHRPLAVHLLRTLIENGFDPAFQMGLQNDKGMCHAIMRPLEFFGTYDIPVVPLLANGYYPPQLPAIRCYEIGRAARLAIDSFPEDVRVVGIGSGGMWHTPVREEPYIDEEFDLTLLRLLEKGNIQGMAELFDSYEVPVGDKSQRILGVAGMTGLEAISGPQMGTREVCEWIAASAMVDGRPQTVVDYIPVYASPIGTAFAYCDKVELCPLTEIGAGS